MTTINHEPRTRREFHEKLAELVQRAAENDVNVEGGWEIRGTAGDADWDVVVTELSKSGPPTEPGGESPRPGS